MTGSGALDITEAAARISKVKAQTDLPVGVGFGIRDADTAKKMASVADAVIVGSVLVQPFGEQSVEVAHGMAVEKIKELRAALDELA